MRNVGPKNLRFAVIVPPCFIHKRYFKGAVIRHKNNKAGAGVVFRAAGGDIKACCIHLLAAECGYVQLIDPADRSGTRIRRLYSGCQLPGRCGAQGIDADGYAARRQCRRGNDQPDGSRQDTDTGAASGRRFDSGAVEIHRA